MANNSGLFSLGRADISISAWVTAGGAGTFTDIGHLEGDAMLEFDREDLMEGSEQVLGSLFSEPIKFGARLKFAAKESSLDNMQKYLGQPAANLSGIVPNKTLLIGDPVATYYQIKVVTKGERTAQGATTAAAQTWTFWRMAIQKPEPLVMSKAKVRLLGFTLEAINDESVTTADKHGKVVNSGGN